MKSKSDGNNPAPSAGPHALTETVKRRVVLGLGANAYGQLVTVIVQLTGVPLLLHAWGTQLYGEWLILFAIPAYLSMSDLGFSQSAANDMTARVARGERVGALAVFQSLSVLVYLVAGAVLILTAAIIPWLPLSEWLHFRVMDPRTAQWVLLLLAAQVIVMLPDGVTHAGFRASGEYALHFGLHSTTRLIQFSGVWLAALAGGGPITAAMVFFLVRLIATASFAFFLIRRHRWLHYGTAHASRAELCQLLRPASANVAVPLAQALNIQGMVVVIGALLGPLGVVVFSTLRTLTRLAMQMVMTVARAAEPELAAAHGAGDAVLLRNLFVHSLRGGLWLALSAAAGLALFGGFILEVWTHGRVAMHPALFALLLGSAVATVPWFSALTMLKAANRHLRAASVYVFASAAAVGLAAILVSWTGELAYAGLALLAMDIVMTIYVLSAVTYFLDQEPKTMLLQALDPRPLMVAALSKISL